MFYLPQYSNYQFFVQFMLVNKAYFFFQSKSDPTISATHGCTALDLASLMEETDTDLIRLLAGQTIEAAPPSMSFLPKSNLTFKNRSMSTPAELHKIGTEGNTGFKAWWGKISNRFRRLKSDKVGHNFADNAQVSINIITDEPNYEESNIRVESMESSLKGSNNPALDTTVFTLGFSAATSDLSSYRIPPLAPPNPHEERLRRSSIIGK